MIKFILNILIRAMKVGLKYDENIKNDFSTLPNGYVVKINILPKNIAVSFKFENNKITKIKNVENLKYNLLVEFKDEKSAKKVLFGKMSLATAFCEHRIKVYGNLNNAIALTRIINLIECYLFPKFIYAKLFSPIPEMKVHKLKFYFMLLFGGNLWNTLNLPTLLKYCLAKMQFATLFTN